MGQWVRVMVVVAIFSWSWAVGAVLHDAAMQCVTTTVTAPK
jgi:hypothetical protein